MAQSNGLQNRTIAGSNPARRSKRKGRNIAIHCDSDVLHAPSTCEFCDRYGKRLQISRIRRRVNFTNTDYPNWKPCPSTLRRPVEVINKWGGNVAVPKGETPPNYLAIPAGWEKMDTVPAAKCDLPPKGWKCNLGKGHNGACPTYPASIRNKIVAWLRFRERF